jgi:septum formation protein
MKKTVHILLASQSERRRELLEKAGFSFEVVLSSYDEKALNKSPKEIVMEHALRKAQEAHLESITFKKNRKNIILGSDTIVAFQGKALGKPKNLQQAEQWLTQMCGNYNEVFTGVALLDENKKILKVDYDHSKVYFKNWTQDEIKDYLEVVSVLDKAGAYAIQSEPQIVERYTGSLTNIIGLSIEKLNALMQEINDL